MFTYDKDVHPQPHIRINAIGGSGDEPYLKDLQDNVLSGRSNIVYVDNSGMDAPTPINSDLSILLILAEESDDHQQLLRCIERACTNSELSIAFVPVGRSIDCQQSHHSAGKDSKNYEMFQWLKKIRAVVDTLVLLNGDRQEVDNAVVGAVPMLLSGSTLIGIDYADIRSVLTCYGSEGGKGVFIAGSVELIDPENPEYDAKRLGTQLLRIAGKSLRYSLGCLDYSRDCKLLLETVIGLYEKLQSILCIESATGAYSVALCSRDEPITESRLVCIAGELKLTEATLDRFVHYDQSNDAVVSGSIQEINVDRYYKKEVIE